MPRQSPPRSAPVGGAAVAAEFDIASDESVAALVAAAVAEFGGLDLMHANAADLSAEVIMRDSDAVAVDLDVFDRTIAVNLRGYLLCTRHSIPAMLLRGRGAIVYTSSAAGHVGEPERPSYGISKSRINDDAPRVFASGSEGIRANCVAPGLVLTEQIPRQPRPRVSRLCPRPLDTPRASANPRTSRRPLHF